MLAAYLLSLMVFGLLIKLAFSGNALTEKAVENGQSIIVRLSNGSIEGHITSSASVKTDNVVTPLGPVPADKVAEPVVLKEPAPTPDNAAASVVPAKPTPTADKSAEPVAPVKPALAADNATAPVAPVVATEDNATKISAPVVQHEGGVPPAWKSYARPYTQKEKRPMVAIVFTNLGLSKSLTEDTLKLPHDFDLGFSPYAGDTKKWAVKAREEGFESLVVLPMQGENYPLSDPGPFGLMEDLSLDDNISRLHGVLAQSSEFIGVLAPVDEKMTANKDAIKPYLSELKNCGMLFLYLKTEKNTALADLAKANGFYALAMDRVIDADAMRGTIDEQLKALIETARKNGSAIGLAHTYPPTLEALKDWVDSLPAQGVDLAPVSAIGKQAFP